MKPIRVKHKPSSKKIYASNRKLNAIFGAETTYLSEEFKEQLRDVSGQNKAREAFDAGTQEDAVRKLNLTQTQTD